MNFARLNHILIPSTREDRERLRRSFLVRAARPLVWLYHALSDEGRALSVLTLFVGTAGMEVRKTQLHILWGALVGLLVGSLLMRRFFRLRRVRLTATTPPRVAIGETLTINLSLRNASERDYHTLRIRAPFLPWDGTWLSPEPQIAQLTAHGSARCEMQARFIERGEHQLDLFHAGALVPLGLALGPLVDSTPCRFVVVPKIARVEHITLPRSVRYQPGGVAQASTVGEAMELMGVRPYRRGDPVRDLHSKTWARTGKPHVREYQQEYFTRIGVILDNDETTGSEATFESAISLAAGVVARLSRGEALIDLLVVGGTVHSLTIGRSLGFFEQALDHLACAKQAPPVDHEQLLARLEPFLSRLSAFIIVTRAEHPKRLRLAAAIERRGIAARVLRVHDDLPKGLAGRQEDKAPVSTHMRERVVLASHIDAEAPLVL